MSSLYQSSSDPMSPHPRLPALKLPRRQGSGSSKLGLVTIDGAEFPSEEEDEEGCRTPTSEEHRIPSRTTCPPAPRKAVGRKRRRSEAEEEEAAASEGAFKGAPVSVSMAEVEEFFRVMERAGDLERVRVVVKGDGRRKKSVAIQLR